jgi:hypothetical protein
MGSAVDQLLGYQHSDEAYTVAHDDVRTLQIEALNERLQERIDRIKLVKLRADEAGIGQVREFADIVPLLLPHTAYKSYPESFLTGQRWDRLTKWLGTVSAYPVDNVDLEGITEIDEWIARLEDAGHYVSCSSGTTGKSAMLIASKADMDWTGEDSVVACSWSTGIAPGHDRHIFRLAPVAKLPRNIAIMDRIHETYGKPGSEMYAYPIPPITVGSITRMVVLRKAIAEGSAQPNEIAEFEATAAQREKALEDAIGITVDRLLAVKGEKLFMSGLWANLYKIASALRDRGFGGSDFHPENMMYVGGGLKGADLPSNYREYVRDTLNLTEERNFQMYGMQEIGSALPRCNEGGRYHVPPWVVCLPLNRDGDALLAMDQGEIEARAAFFDLSLDGRWGGVISGDRIEVDFGPCACGAGTPSIRDNVARYKDLVGDDKISCSGTVDAYVRGLS